MKAKARIKYLDKKRQYVHQDTIRGLEVPLMDFRDMLDWADPRREYAEIEIVDEHNGRFSGPVFRRHL